MSLQPVSFSLPVCTSFLASGLRAATPTTSGRGFFQKTPWLFNPCIWMFPENSGFSPQISSHFNRVFHYFHHPFWGTPIFGNTHLESFKNKEILLLRYSTILGFQVILERTHSISPILFHYNWYTCCCSRL